MAKCNQTLGSCNRKQLQVYIYLQTPTHYLNSQPQALKDGLSQTYGTQ